MESAASNTSRLLRVGVAPYPGDPHVRRQLLVMAPYNGKKK